MIDVTSLRKHEINIEVEESDWERKKGERKKSDH